MRNASKPINRIGLERRRTFIAWVFVFFMSVVAMAAWSRPLVVKENTIVGMSKSDCMEYAETMCNN